MVREHLEYEQWLLYQILKETSEDDETIANIDDIVASTSYSRKKIYEYLRQLKMLGYIQAGKPDYLVKLWKVV